MIIDHIRDRVAEVEVGPIGIKRKYSVLIPLIQRNGQWHILYELRAKDMDRQPGEISFPGGGVEFGETFEEAAIRETMEELKISRDKIEVLGEIEYLLAMSGTCVHCFVGVISDVDVEKITPNKAEVDHVFTVPLKYLLENDPDVYKIEFESKVNHEFPYNLIPNGIDYNWTDKHDTIYFYVYEDYSIWGFTARMTKSFVDIIKKDPIL